MRSLTNRYCAHKWVCFDCHTSVKRCHAGIFTAIVSKDAKCQHCGKPMVRLGYKIPIPKKTDTKLWAALRKQILGVKNKPAWNTTTALAHHPKHWKLIKRAFGYD
jgi:hypothetical protein